MVHGVEKAAYIGFDEVIDTLLLDGSSQCIEALVRTAPRAVAETTGFE